MRSTETARPESGSPPTLEVEVLLFASVAEAVGARRRRLQIPGGATAFYVFDRLAAGTPSIARLRPCLSFAVNREFVSGDTVLSAGDELALIPPVAGGA